MLHALEALARTRVFSSALSLALCHPVHVIDAGEAEVRRKLFTRFDCLEFSKVAVLENPATLSDFEFADKTGEAGNASIRAVSAAVTLSRIFSPKDACGARLTERFRPINGQDYLH